jgi:ATP citrate (pro-S)-lyase
MPISKVFSEEIGIGGVLSILWFKRQFPAYATKFIEMTIMVTADHGPAVSGAHNTIVAARAGKDLISSVASGMLTIGPRFGGAIDGAAQMFSDAYDRGLTPNQFVEEMKKKGENIQGIGHMVKSIHNPDMRVTIMKEYAKKHFKATPLLDYALEVEKVTTARKTTLS